MMKMKKTRGNEEEKEEEVEKRRWMEWAEGKRQLNYISNAL